MELTVQQKETDTKQANQLIIMAYNKGKEQKHE